MRTFARAAALAFGIGAAYAIRRVGRRSGCTDAEASATLPGDDIVREPMWQSTRGITIDRPSEEIWPWLAQMGYPKYRAGWYTPHRLDRAIWGIDEASADVIRPELQALAVGDRIPDSRDWSVYFTVADVDPPTALVLHSTRHVLKPIRAVDFSWAFVLRASGPRQTRLLIRSRARYAPPWAAIVAGPLIGPADFVNVSWMLRGIKARAQQARPPAA